MNWTAPPNNALWYAEVVVQPPVGDVTYNYGYSADIDPPNIKYLVPDGWEMLSFEIKPTPRNAEYETWDG